MTLAERSYGALLSVIRVLSPALGMLRPDLAADLAERRNAPALMRLWARDALQAELPLLWLHGPSAGELLGAAPVLAVLRQRRDFQLVVTFTSGSARTAVERLQPDYAGLAPVDTPQQSRSALNALSPSAIVFAKLDVWPGLTRTATSRGVPLGLINATVRPDSSRLRPLVRSLLRPAYGYLDRVGAATPADRQRLLALGVRPDACNVTGDAAFDLALERVERARVNPSSAHRTLEGRTGRLPDVSITAEAEAPLRVVAGSTWPEDEELLLLAGKELSQSGVPCELVLVPHQPSPAAVERLRRRCREVLGEEADLWTELDGAAHSAATLIVDTVGPLAELYLAADVGYVGGGHGEAGLHSVIEPAAAGVPVLFGPRHSRREASELLALGAAREVKAETATRVIQELVESPDERLRMGQSARAYVEEGAGAGTASADLIAGLLSG